MINNPTVDIANTVLVGGNFIVGENDICSEKSIVAYVSGIFLH